MEANDHGQGTATQQQREEKTEAAEEADHPHGSRAAPGEEIIVTGTEVEDLELGRRLWQLRALVPRCRAFDPCLRDCPRGTGRTGAFCPGVLKNRRIQA